MGRHTVALMVGVALATTTLGAAVGERYEPTAAASTVAETQSTSEWTIATGSLDTTADPDTADAGTVEATNPYEHLGHDAVVDESVTGDDTSAGDGPDVVTQPDPEPNDEAESTQATAASFDPPPGGPSPTGALGIPVRALEAYRAGAASYGARCSLGWDVLAGVGRAESGHANGGRLYPDGTTWQPILGPVLDGGAFAAIADSDGGRLDGDEEWDRAVGPMQFLPGTWAWIGVDADGDGTADPHDIDDAAATAARYLCLGGGDLSDREQLRSALLRYNASSAYADAVIAWADGYADRAAPVDGPSEPPPEPTPAGQSTTEDDASTADEPSSTTTATPSPSATPTPTSKPTSSAQPSPSVEPTPTTTPSTTPGTTPGPTPSPTASPTASPTPTGEATPSSDPTPSDDPTTTPQSTSTVEPTTSAEPTPSEP